LGLEGIDTVFQVSTDVNVHLTISDDRTSKVERQIPLTSIGAFIPDADKKKNFGLHQVSTSFQGFELNSIVNTQPQTKLLPAIFNRQWTSTLINQGSIMLRFIETIRQTQSGHLFIFLRASGAETFRSSAPYHPGPPVARVQFCTIDLVYF
jgi:hypothetical protein